MFWLGLAIGWVAYSIIDLIGDIAQAVRPNPVVYGHQRLLLTEDQLTESLIRSEQIYSVHLGNQQDEIHNVTVN